MKTGECFCCRSKGIPVRHYSKVALGPRATEGQKLCDICGDTLLSTWLFYPEQHDGDSIEIMKMIAYAANLIRKEIQNG